MPEIPVLGFISFCQTNNIILIINLFLIIGNFDIVFEVHYAYLIFNILLYILNYYYYQTKKKGKKILQQKKHILKKHGFWVDVYLILSIFLAGYTFYIYREYFWKPFLD